jgi:hypothetical protein
MEAEKFTGPVQRSGILYLEYDEVKFSRSLGTFGGIFCLHLQELHGVTQKDSISYKEYYLQRYYAVW